MRGYVVVDRSGHVRSHVCKTLAGAKRACHHDGDSVIEVEIDLSKEPLFIRSKKL